MLEADAVCSDDPVSGAGAVGCVEDVAEVDASLVDASELLVVAVTGVDSDADALPSVARQSQGLVAR